MSYLSILTNEYIEIIQLSLYVSVFATVLAFLFSLLLSSYLLLNNFQGKGLILLIVNSLMSLPPVVVGLFLYIIFSNSGVLGFIDILYSPTIMIIAQFIIITPIITSLLYTVFENKYHEISEYMSSLNVSRGKIINTIILETRFDLVIVSMTGLGRALSEVGAVIIVGGNISNISRVMTTSIVLETSRGELELAMYLGLSLIIIAILINLVIFLVKRIYL